LKAVIRVINGNPFPLSAKLPVVDLYLLKMHHDNTLSIRHPRRALHGVLGYDILGRLPGNTHATTMKDVGPQAVLLCKLHGSVSLCLAR
jgi:hypothetical protein